jgi:hypothetical protein
MARPDELRARAAVKRRTAGVARQAGTNLSVAADRALMLQHAQELEAEAVGLEAQATALEAGPSN